ncbi:Mini-ribonuclease 3 [Hutsoniella sourekii]
MVNAHLLNGAALAYIGDAIYEVYVRAHVLEKGLTDPNLLHKSAIKYVEASGQAKVMRHWLNQEDFLSQEEIQYFKRGRNHKANTKAKNASIGDYRQATGFESLIGWHYLAGNEERLVELITCAIQLIDTENDKRLGGD